MYLTLFFAALPIIPAVLFSVAPIPPMQFGEKSATKKSKRGLGLAFCTACIFLGGAVENSMTNWISSYIESALKIPKMVGDILGLCLFAVLLGLGRSLYAKRGKNIGRVLLFGMCGSFFCYLLAGLCTVPIVAMIACVLVGACSSMLWPGTLIFMEEKMPGVGVAAYALMAAGGDFGSSVAPQLVGVVIDKMSTGGIAQSLSKALLLSPEQIGLKAGMLVASVFALLGIILIICMLRYFKKTENI
jgi:MFS family permease